MPPPPPPAPSAHWQRAITHRALGGLIASRARRPSRVPCYGTQPGLFTYEARTPFPQPPLRRCAGWECRLTLWRLGCRVCLTHTRRPALLPLRRARSPAYSPTRHVPRRCRRPFGSLKAIGAGRSLCGSRAKESCLTRARRPVPLPLRRTRSPAYSPTRFVRCRRRRPLPAIRLCCARYVTRALASHARAARPARLATTRSPAYSPTRHVPCLRRRRRCARHRVVIAPRALLRGALLNSRHAHPPLSPCGVRAAPLIALRGTCPAAGAAHSVGSEQPVPRAARRILPHSCVTTPPPFPRAWLRHAARPTAPRGTCPAAPLAAAAASAAAAAVHGSGR